MWNNHSSVSLYRCDINRKMWDSFIASIIASAHKDWCPLQPYAESFRLQHGMIALQLESYVWWKWSLVIVSNLQKSIPFYCTPAPCSRRQRRWNLVEAYGLPNPECHTNSLRIHGIEFCKTNLKMMWNLGRFSSTWKYLRVNVCSRGRFGRMFEPLKDFTFLEAYRLSSPNKSLYAPFDLAKECR